MNVSTTGNPDIFHRRPRAKRTPRQMFEGEAQKRVNRCVKALRSLGLLAGTRTGGSDAEWSRILRGLEAELAMINDSLFKTGEDESDTIEVFADGEDLTLGEVHTSGSPT